MNKITIDFETRSQASLFEVGAYRYSMDPTTDALCIGWSGKNQWRMGDKPPKQLFAAIKAADIVEAHNAFFEICVWQNVCAARYGWPEVPFSKWRCTAAKAAAYTLPRSLLEAGKAMGLKVVKDELYGSWAMKKLSRPRKPTKKDDSIWHNAPEDWKLMLEYNNNDVEAEEELSASLLDLSESELEFWRLTERMNLRGIPIDVEGVKKAVRLAGEHAKRLTDRFQKLTGLESAGQRAKFLLWLNNNGVEVTSTDASTLDAVLGSSTNTPANVYEAIQIVREIGRSSIAKYRSMLAMEHKGRVYGTFLYCGAAATGRWAGRGMQPHNFPRDAVIKNQDTAWSAIHTCDLDSFGLLADPLEALSGALRGAICAPEGHEFLCGDKAQIEARITFWLAGEVPGLDLFRTGDNWKGDPDLKPDVYCDAAATIFGRTVTKKDKDERFLGKQATLALGFGAGFVKYLVHCRALGAPRFTKQQIYTLVPAGQREALWGWITSPDGLKMVKRLIPNPTREDLMELVLTKYIVDRWRKRYKDTVVKLWGQLQEAATNAIQEPGTVFQVNEYLSYQCEGIFLKLTMPSGRKLHYPYPELSAHGDVTYMRQDNHNQFVREKTYGGKLLENAVQATARDVLAEAMLRLEKHPPYDHLVMTIHDEVVSQVKKGAGTLKEFIDIMKKPPEWAPGLPIEVEGWRGVRYRK